MFELWIPITVAAAFCQNLRSAIQKHLTGTLSGQGAAYSRFLFALPWALIYLIVLVKVFNWSLPTLTPKFLLYCFLGSVSQIIATVLLLKTFNYRSFAVGTTFSKLEIVVVALLGAIVLKDALSIWGQIAIGLSAIGLVALSAGQNRLTIPALLRGITEKATLLGLGSAVFLGGAVVFFRGASLALNHDSAFFSAAVTLAAALLIQTLTMGLYLGAKEPGEILRVAKSWRWSSLVGIAGMLASIGWFTAFTLQNASYVRALGQIELIFAFVATTRVFREKVNPMEVVGCVLIVCAIILLMVFR